MIVPLCLDLKIHIMNMNQKSTVIFIIQLDLLFLALVVICLFLKQYVEIERQDSVDHWHPECYMIQKVKKIKIKKRVLPFRVTFHLIVLECSNCPSYKQRK